MKPCKLFVNIVCAAVLLSALASVASARRFSVSEQTLRVTYEQAQFRGGFGTTRCDLTLEGSLHTRSIVKTPELLIGYITRAEKGTCLSGGATILEETLPWHVRYASFSGTLPDITAVGARVIGAAIRVREPNGVNCLFRSSEAEPITVSFTVEHVTLREATLGGSIRSGSECFGATGTISGASKTLTTPAAGLIEVRLI